MFGIQKVQITEMRIIVLNFFKGPKKIVRMIKISNYRDSNYCLEIFQGT